MAAMKKPNGSHKEWSFVACNRCGHKERWTATGLALMRLHIANCQPDLTEKASED